MKSSLLTILIVLLNTALAFAQPDIPSLLRDVHLMEEDGNGDIQFTTPVIPPHRTTQDGRIAYNQQGLAINLFEPKRLNTHFRDADPGNILTVNDVPFLLPMTSLENTTMIGGTPRFSTICDPTPQIPTNFVARRNPYIGGENNDRDCYDVTHIMGLGSATMHQFEMWGTSMTIEVSNPKTAQAQLSNIIFGTPDRGYDYIYVRHFFEPVFD